MKELLKRKGTPLLLFSFLMSAGVLLICSKSSPLYPMNDWVDVHCFFTVGKSILHGIVPYADLYEQKGPVLYFAYALAALISSKTFWGVFLLEVTTFALFLYFSGKTAMVYLGDSRMTYFIVAALAAAIPLSPAFAHGGGVEELSLFMLTYGLYSVCAALHEKRFLTFREAFLNGIFAAMILFSKFTMLGFYLGLALFVVFWYLSHQWQWKTLFQTIGHFLLGVGAVTALVLLYFGIHGAIGDLFTVYFYNNIFLYPHSTESSRWGMILNCLQTMLQINTSFVPWILMGIGLFIIGIRRHWEDPVMVLMCFAGLTIGTYWGGRGYAYYGLVFAVFAMFGLIAIARLIQVVKLPKLLEKPLNYAPWAFLLSILLTVSILFSICCNRSSNVYLMYYDKEDLPPYRFAETINQMEDPRILNLGFLDGGFYHAADVLPGNRFFCTLNINLPEMWDDHRQCLEAGDVDFVITRYYKLNRYTPYGYKYSLVDEASFYFEGMEFTYYLYARKPGY